MQKPIGLILAGGRSTRMGGSDKGLMLYHDKPLIAHLIERLSPQVGQLLISANRNLEAYRRFGYPVIEDTLTGFQGPLAGLLSALNYLAQQSRSPIDVLTDLLVTPVDLPRLPRDLYQRLSHSKADTPDANRHIYVPHDGRRVQPLVMLLPLPDHETLTGYRNSLLQQLKNGERKVARWLDNQNCIQVDFADQPDGFANINTPDELQALAQHHHDE